MDCIELTRGRKSKYEKVGKIEKRLTKIETFFNNREICLDLTTSSQLSNEEIERLFRPNNGYSNWINFLLTQQRKNIYKNLIPVILVDTSDQNLYKNLSSQTSKLCDTFSTIAYRNSISDDGCYEDIENIKNILDSNDTGLIFIIDCEYVAPGAWVSFAKKISTRVQKINNLIGDTRFILVSTSFPRLVSDIGHDISDTFNLIEIDMYNSVKKSVSYNKFYFGDYGTINPIRNDVVPMSRGWIPRIDVPLSNVVFYHRLRRRESQSYSETYKKLAKNYILKDSRFPSSLRRNWGIEQIISCAEGNSPGSSPSFWISVRMNIHIEQQLRRLKLL